MVNSAVLAMLLQDAQWRLSSEQAAQAVSRTDLVMAFALVGDKKNLKEALSEKFIFALH